MATEAPTPLPVRASDSERERAVRALRERSLEGRLSIDTFSRRVGRAYEARSRDELGELLRDLPPSGRAARVLTEATSWISGLLVYLENAWRRPRIPRLALPADSRIRLTVGRSLGNDFCVSDATVSRHHAELRRRGDVWWLADLGSTNGTRLNGLRLIEPVPVRPGDQVTFGGSRFRFSGL